MSLGFPDDLPVIDAHHHFWDIQKNYHPWLRDEPMIPFRYGDYSSIRRNYLPDDYFADSKGINIVGTVYVETEWDPKDPVGETVWVHELAQQTGFPNAVVAQAWLDSDDIDAVLAAHANYALVRSVRHKPASTSREDATRNTAGSMDDDKWRQGFSCLNKHGLHFDLQTPWWHLDQACDLARDFPATQIIVNHTGLPADRDTDSLKLWHVAMKRLAQYPNVHVKISGICVPGENWSARANRWIVDETIAMFGSQRSMFASNFPVDGVCNSFQEIYAGFAQITEQYSAADRKSLFHDTAMSLYAINPVRHQHKTSAEEPH